MSIESMIVSAEQAASTKHFEGKVLNKVSNRHLAYVCAGDEKTIGYGHTEQDGVLIRGFLGGKPYEGQAVVDGLEIEEGEAERLLKIDLERHASIVRTAVQVDLTQPMFDALSDLAFNIGHTPFRKGSDLLAALNGGVSDNGSHIGPRDYAEAQKQLLRWKRVKGNPNEAVYERRMANALRWAGKPWWWVRAIDLGTSLSEALTIADRKGEADHPEPPVFYRDPPIAPTVDKDLFEEAADALAENYEDMTPNEKTEYLNERELEKLGGEVEAIPAPPSTKPVEVVRRVNTVELDAVPYISNPAPKVKKMDESQRGKGFAKTQTAREVGVVGVAGTAATAVGAMEPAVKFVDKYPKETIAYVFFALLIASVVYYYYGKWQRQKGEDEAEDLLS